MKTIKVALGETTRSGLGTAMSQWLSTLPRGEASRPHHAERSSKAAVPVERATRARSPAPTSVAVLSPREVDVLRLLAADCTYAQAAQRLGVSPHTVVTHVKNAYRKLDVHSAAAAVMRVVQLGLLAVDALHKPAAPSPDANALAVLSDR